MQQSPKELKNMILKIMGRGFLWAPPRRRRKAFHDFFVDRHDFFVDRHDFCWPLASCISSCILRYFFGRRNPYFCMR